jgi:arylsulfatase A
VRRNFVSILFLAVLANSRYPADARQPNIILILADDLGYETLGTNGSDHYKTPNLDRLAATGVRFERCSVQPLCTPTRLQLMTGQYNVRNYIAWATIDPHSTTFGNLLKSAGYSTGIAGKWQLGRVKDLPQRLGFDESCLWQHMRRPPRYANPGLEYNGDERDFRNGEYGPDLVNDFALDFITRHKSEPFFLYYPMMLTHSPYQPTPDSPDWDPKAMGGDVNEDPKHFVEMVAYMDKLVGRLVKKVDDLDLRENTLIIFVGDNGTGRRITSPFEGAAYEGGKGSTSARGMRVPLIANWPGHAPAGSTNADLVDSTDFLPTICAAAGAQVPATLTFDGRSFLPQILGKKGQPREWIYTWFSKDGQPPISEFVSTKKYKLYRDGRFYDLTKDPYEDRPPRQIAELTGAEAAAGARLKAVLAEYTNARPADRRPSAPDASQKAARDSSRRAKNGGDE